MGRKGFGRERFNWMKGFGDETFNWMIRFRGGKI